MDKKILEALLDSKFPMEESTRYFKGMIYGDPGGGKTVTGATIGNRILFVEADPEGWQSLFNHPELTAHNRMERLEYLGISQIEALADAFTESVPEFREFDTVQIDTGSNISTLDLDVVTKVSMKKKGDSFSFDDDMWGNYKQNAHRVRMAFLKLFLAPVNIVMTAHARDITVKKLGVEYGMKTVPDFSPKILASINGMTSMIAYMTAEGGKGVDEDGSVKYTRKLQVHPTRTITAKTRIGGLPQTITLPDDIWGLRRIVDKWQATGGQLLEEKDAPMDVPLEKSEELTGLEI